MFSFKCQTIALFSNNYLVFICTPHDVEPKPIKEHVKFDEIFIQPVISDEQNMFIQMSVSRRIFLR